MHVDDDPSILEISKQILTDMGSFEIDHAYCVQDAFKKLASLQYDIVISDYEMPQKNGLQFLKELRMGKNDIPFILFTGKGREEVVIEALNLGADHYVNKQGSPGTVYSELAHLVSSAVEKSRAKLKNENDSLALHNVHDAIVSSDANFIITTWNKAAEELFGFSSLEMLQRNIVDVFSKIQVKPTFDELIFQLKTTGQFRGEVVYQNKNGKLRNGDLRIVSIVSENSKILGNVAVCRDITERKKTEESLKGSEEKFRNLAEESPNMIFINQMGRVVYANKKCEDTMGYMKEEFYSPNFKFLSVIAPNNLEALKSSFAAHMRGEEVPPYEYVLVTKDGQKIEAIITSKLIEYDGKKAILGIVTDINERKRNEAKSRQSEEQFRQLFSNMPSGVAIYEAVDNGEDFVVSDFNPAAETIEKISKTDVLGKRVTQVFPGAKSFGIVEVFQRVWRTGKPEYYPAALYKDDKGSNSWRENWVYKLPNGNVTAIYDDISERIETDVTLWKERERLESVTASIDAGLVIVSKSYHLLWENDFIRRYKGDVNGKLCYATLNTLNAPCPDCGVAKIFAGKTTSDVHEYCSTTVDGNPYWVEIIASPVKDENGEVVAASELAVDITKRKQVEQELLESNLKFRALFDANPDAALFLNTDFE